MAQAASGQNKCWSVSRSFPCWPTLLALDNENVKSELPLAIFTPLLPCSVLFLNLSVWGFPALWVGWVQETEGVFKMMMITVMAWFPAPCCLLLLSRVQQVGAQGKWGNCWTPVLAHDPTTALRRPDRLKTWIMCHKGAFYNLFVWDSLRINLFVFGKNICVVL